MLDLRLNHDSSGDINRSWTGLRASSRLPFVSIVIPCYNQGHFLNEAIETALEQTYRRREVIVVDDGSTDNTREVVSSYPGLVYIYQQNSGLSAARNRGLAESSGDCVVFLDADDRLLPGALEAGVKCLSSHPECAFVFGGYRVISAEGRVKARWRHSWKEDDYYHALLHKNYICMPAMVMYRRSVFNFVTGFDTAVSPSADYELYLRIARQFPICGHNRIVADYRHHGSNMSNNAALMLTTTISVLRSQWPHARRNPKHREAYKEGMKFWKGFYGERLVNEVRQQIRGQREWRKSLRSLLLLARYYPRGFAGNAYRKLRCMVLRRPVSQA